MKKTVHRSDLGGGLEQVSLEYRSAPCAHGSPESRREQIELLQQIANTPMLHNCGGSPFATLDMRHDGDCWVLVLEAKQRKMTTSEF